MAQILHGSATTTEAVRRAIQHSQESLRRLAKRYGVNPKTVAKWKARTSVSDLPTGPREPRSTVLSAEEEAAAGRRDGSVLFWRDPGAEPTVFRIDGRGSPDAVALSRSALYAGGSDGAITVWPLTGGGSIRYEAHKNRITFLQIAADSKTVLSGSTEGPGPPGALDGSFQEVVHSVWSVNADVVKRQ
jgi:WD40 repeat protein